MIILVNYKRKNWFQKLFSNKDNETYIVYYRKDNTNEVEIHSEFPTYMKNFYKLDGEFYYNKQLKVLINKNTSEKFSTWDLVKNSESLDFNIENLSWYIYERYYGTNTVISFIPYIITKIDKNIIYRNKEIYEMFEYLYYNILDELP